MRSHFFLVLLAGGALHLNTVAQPLTPTVFQLQVRAHPEVADLACQARAPVPKAASNPTPDPLEVPTDDMVRALTSDADLQHDGQHGTQATPKRPVQPLSGLGVQRIAIWGDSHLAAGFFSEELSRQLKIPADNVSNLLLPANMGRAGVRLPLQRSCVSSDWKYELGYLGGDAARMPGPGLVNMVSDRTNASIAWDLRNQQRMPNYERVRILYQQTQEPVVLGISVDGEPETEVTLAQAPGPAALELLGDKPLSQVKIRLVAGTMRFHGLDLQTSLATGIGMDVFGYPGATVAGWKQAQLDYLASWFGQRDYQLVILEFGTNEGAAKPFDSNAYRKMLGDSVRNMRSVFPNAACILVAPGDRGILVPQSASLKKRAKGKRKAQSGPKIDLFVYSRIHAEIERVQREVAEEAGCGTWSMMEAMGGPGQSYSWARQSPPLMARDLIHFTVAGYQRFAQKFARDMGWTALPQNDR